MVFIEGDLVNLNLKGGIINSRRKTETVLFFLIERKHSRKDRQVKASFREPKAQIHWPSSEQKVWGSNPYGRTNRISE